MHNHPFDAKHTFKVNRFTDIERYEKMDETYIEPETEEYAPRVISSLFQYPIV
jgi:translation initiation factor 3 subunit B